MNVGENIKKIRKAKGITQKELGKRLGISQAAIGQFENPEANLKLETIQKIAAALGVSIHELTEDCRSEEFPYLSEINIINSVLLILENAGYTIIQAPCFLNHGDWNVRTITTDNKQEIKAAFNDKLEILTRGCKSYKAIKMQCISCENNKYTEYIIQKGKKRISITIDEMQKHIDDIVKYTDFLFS